MELKLYVPFKKYDMTQFLRFFVIKVKKIIGYKCSLRKHLCFCDFSTSTVLLCAENDKHLKKLGGHRSEPILDH